MRHAELTRHAILGVCSLTAAVALLSTEACGGQHTTPTPQTATAPAATATAPAAPILDAEQPPLAPRSEAAPLTLAQPPDTPAHCTPADWSTRALPRLLKPGKTRSKPQPDRLGAQQDAFLQECTDAPGGPPFASPPAVVVDGVELRLAAAIPAGATGRGWTGNQCVFDVRLADGSGPTVRLGPNEVAPFTTLSALVRSGSAAWLAFSFNGYTKEFPGGGNRIIALDLCSGAVSWKSADAMSNGGLLLLGDYLLSPYGFTSERRYVFVLDARSGHVVQKLPIVENLCPSKSWAPNWHAGERCDAPGQAVGAATNPRVEGGLFWVDTNTGSSSFQF